MAGKDAVNFELVLATQRRNFHAARAARIEAPAVVAALHGLPIEVAVGKRNTAMRTGIAHSEGAAVRSAAEHERHFEEHSGGEIFAADCAAAYRGIPEIPQESWILARQRWDCRSVVRLQNCTCCFTH